MAADKPLRPRVARALRETLEPVVLRLQGAHVLGQARRQPVELLRRAIEPLAHRALDASRRAVERLQQLVTQLARPVRLRRSAWARAGRPRGRPASRRSRGRRRTPPGAALLAIARTTASSLNDHRSSIEPPPRHTISVSTSARWPACCNARTSCDGASGPCTALGYTMTRTCGARRASVVSTSCNAAPAVELITPIARGNFCDRPFALRVEQSSGLQARPLAQEQLVHRARAARQQRFDHALQLAARLVDQHAAAHLHVLAVARREVEQRGSAPKHRATQDGVGAVGVLQREVAVAARGSGEPRQLAAHRHGAEAHLQRVARRQQEFGHAEHARRGRRPSTGCWRGSLAAEMGRSRLIAQISGNPARSTQ